MPRKKQTEIDPADPLGTGLAPLDTDTVTVKAKKPTDLRVSEVSRARAIAKKRIESGDTRPVQSQVPLRNQPEPMTTRRVNTSISGRAHEITEYKGWVAVRFEELANPGSGEFKRTPDGLVSSGANGHQVLYKIPSSVYKEIAWAKSKRESSRLSSRTKMSQGAANAAATSSDKAASVVENFGIDQFEATRSFKSLD